MCDLLLKFSILIYFLSLGHQVCDLLMSCAWVLNLLWQTNLKFVLEFLINTMYVGLECFRRLQIGCRMVQKDPGGSRRVPIGKWYLISWQNKCEHQVMHGDLGHSFRIQLLNNYFHRIIEAWTPSSIFVFKTRLMQCKQSP